MNDADAPTASVLAAGRRGRVRWIICFLLFAAVVLSYVDRLVLSILKPTLQGLYHWSEGGYGDVVFWFQAAYGIGFAVFGWIVDRIGPKRGYVLAMLAWTAAHIAHAFVTTTRGFTLVRIALGIGESGTYPSALAAAGAWFPKRESALAIGIFNAGANVGAIVTPLLVPILVLAISWQAAFIVTGLFNLVWIAAWLLFYRAPRQHPSLGASELAWIESEPVEAQKPVAWRRLLATRQAWAYMAGRFLIDPIWWTFLFWLPDFFSKRYGLDLRNFGPPLVAVYVMADVGSVLGGYYSSRLLGRGVETGRARKRAMLFAALIVVPVVFAMQAPGVWIAVLLIGLACAGHQGFSANLFAMPGDLFPRWALGSVVGLGGFAGAMGSMLMAKYAGWVLGKFGGDYTPIFIVSGCAYLVALAVVHLINPTYARVTKFAAA
ncbi:MAG TPA: MFS transporter [Allosphingosinicella sp.]|nr:MFS transporter [Allosphingosinicella sp.]